MTFAWTRTVFLAVVWAMAGAPPSRAAEGARLRLGYFPNLTHGQALYARATGELEKRLGMRIEWTAFNAGPTAIEALFSDAVDAAFVGPGPTINGYLRSHGSRFVVIAGAAIGGAGMVIRPDSGIRTERDFAGRVIATPQLGNTQDVAARAWFLARGYRLLDRGGNVSLVPLSNPDQLTLFRKKQIDAAWTVEPWIARLEVEADGVLFLDESTLWPEGRFITTHLVMTRAYLAAHPETASTLVDGIVEITGKLNADPAAAATLLNEQLRKETGKALKTEVIQRAMGRVKFTWDPIASSLAQSADAAFRIGFLRKQPDLGGLYALDSLNQALVRRNLPPVPSAPSTTRDPEARHAK